MNSKISKFFGYILIIAGVGIIFGAFVIYQASSLVGTFFGPAPTPTPYPKDKATLTLTSPRWTNSGHKIFTSYEIYVPVTNNKSKILDTPLATAKGTELYFNYLNSEGGKLDIYCKKGFENYRAVATISLPIPYTSWWYYSCEPDEVFAFRAYDNDVKLHTEIQWK